VPYFTAILARTAGAWRARLVDVDGAEDVHELAERLRAVAFDDEPVLLVLEREDAWFAVARVEGAEDPKVFVSDAAAARASTYAGALGVDPDGVDEGPVGDLDVLEDLGTSAAELTELTGEDGPATDDAVVRLAEAAGFAEVVESLR